jgi:hypothetical protein
MTRFASQSRSRPHSLTFLTFGRSWKSQSIIWNPTGQAIELAYRTQCPVGLAGRWMIALGLMLVARLGWLGVG